MPGHRPSLRRAVSAATCVIRVACAVLLGACTTPVYEGFTDPSFTYPLVRSGGLLVGGVASSIDPLPARIADREAELLAAAIRSERPGLPVQTAALADPRFAAAGQAARLQALARGPLPPETYAALAPLRKAGRFVVYARLENDAVRQEHDIREHDLPDPMREARDRKGKRILVPLYDRAELVESFTTRRVVDVRYTVLDLDARREVWSGRIEKSAEASNRVTLAEGESGSFGYVAPAVPPPGAFPPPPVAGRLIEAAHRGFAENLPEAP